MWKLEIDDDLENPVSLYESSDMHNHDQVQQPHHGIPQFIREEIVNLEQHRVNTPRLIRNALQQTIPAEEQVPSLMQIRNFLQTHRNNRRGGTTFNIRQLEEFCRERMEVSRKI